MHRLRRKWKEVDVTGRDMLLDGQNVREEHFPDEAERISKSGRRNSR
ncbi:MAG: hypothetical protein ACLSEA_10125 [Thomasclavelia ramosa]